MCDDSFPDWIEIGILDGLSEELAEEELERYRIEAERKADKDPEV